MRKRDLSEVMVRAVMTLQDGAKTRVRVRSAYSEEFEDWCTSRICAVTLLFAIVMDVIIQKARRRVVNKLLHAYDLVLMSETM